MASFLWDDAAIATLQRLHGFGWSFSQIGAELKKQTGIYITRNAVIGKANRLGISGSKGSAPRPRAPAKEKRAPRPRMIKAPLHKGTVFVAAKVIPLDRAPAAVDASNSRNIDLMNLTEDTCHFPFGEESPFKFCGHRVTITRAGNPSAYCQHHNIVCHGAGTVSERNVVSRKMLEAAE